MSDILHRHGARLINGVRRFFPPNGTVGVFNAEEDGELVQFIGHPNGRMEELAPASFFRAQRAQGVHIPDDPTYAGALTAAAAAGNLVQLPAAPLTQDAATTLTDVDVRGHGQVSNLTTATTAGQYAMRFVRGASGRFRSARDFMLTVATACENAIRLEYPRFLLQHVRVTAQTGVTVSDAIVRLEQCFIAQLHNVFVVAADAGQVPLRLGTNANAVDIIGGEYAGPGNCIVVDGGRRINIQTCIEGTGVNVSDGLEINGGDTIYVLSYFENKGIEVNGGRRITLGGSFANSEAVIAINGGKQITIRDAYWPATTHPRAAVIVAAGLDHQVRFTQAVDFGNSGGTATKFVLAESVVDGEDMGPNLLPDAFFDRWTDPNTPTDYTITKIGSSATIAQTATRLTGQYGLRWDSNTTATSSTRGIKIDLTSILDQCKGHWVTVGAWMFVPTAASQDPWYRVNILTTPSGVQSDVDYLPLPTASNAARASKWVFFSHSTYVDTDTTDLWVQVDVVNTQSGSEYFILDRMAVVLGKTAQNVPFHITAGA